MVQTGPRTALLLLGLTAGTGMVDAVSYLRLSHVFVANMTGNVVFLGFALAGAEGISVSYVLTSVAAFLLGALVASRVIRDHASSHRMLGSISTMKAALVAAAALVATQPLAGAVPYAIIVLLAAAMGMQNATVRKIGVADLTTTVLTLTLTGLAADSSLAGGENPRFGRRVMSVVAMLVGALVGGAIVLHAGVPLALIATATVMAIVAVTAASLARTPAEAAG